MKQPDLQTEITSTGRVVTVATAWWFKNTTTEKHFNLFCVHEKRLTVGCNECLDSN